MALASKTVAGAGCGMGANMLVFWALGRGSSDGPLGPKGEGRCSTEPCGVLQQGFPIRLVITELRGMARCWGKQVDTTTHRVALIASTSSHKAPGQACSKLSPLRPVTPSKHRMGRGQRSLQERCARGRRALSWSGCSPLNYAMVGSALAAAGRPARI